MKQKRIRSRLLRAARLIVFVVLGHPLILVTVPLSVGLVIHLIMTVTRGEQQHGLTTGELLGCIGVVTALCLFSIIAMLYLVMTVCEALRGRVGITGGVARTSAAGVRGLDGTLTRAQLLDRLTGLAKKRRLIGPVARTEPACTPPVRYFYDEVRRPEDIALGFNYCVFSPKASLLPPRETLIQFDRGNGRFTAKACFDERPIALVGVHPCDLHAIRLLDKVFTQDHADVHYQSRRMNAFIIGIDCRKPCTEGVFCRDTGTNHAESGFDVMLYPFGSKRDGNGEGLTDENDLFGVVFGSDAGRAWLTGRIEGGGGSNGSSTMEEPDSESTGRFSDYLESKRRAFPRRLKAEWNAVPELLRQSYDSLLWHGTAQRCYSCGSCNLVCPTCYCFDIRDESGLDADRGRRERCWDGCMLHDFSLVAGGHNFRSHAAQRLRHRIFRKGAWIGHRTGQHGCVGCGRCDRACTAHISIVQILNQLAEENQHASR